MNNDLISRKALKREFGYTDEWYKGRTVCAIIDNAPTVDFMISPDYVTELQNRNKELIKQLEDMERPQGEWKTNLTTGDIFCSCCKGVRRDTRINHINFCNSCGADMRGEKNDEQRGVNTSITEL